MLRKRYIKSRKVAKVTFELPKSEWPEEVQVNSIHLVGDFNDWDPSATPMKRGKGGAYRAIVELEPGKGYQFRYLVNGEHWCNDWHADAYVPSGAGPDNCVVYAPTAPVAGS
jgi:1,4-alpha-glucan branching enzyme